MDKLAFILFTIVKHTWKRRLFKTLFNYRQYCVWHFIKFILCFHQYSLNVSSPFSKSNTHYQRDKVSSKWQSYFLSEETDSNKYWRKKQYTEVSLSFLGDYAWGIFFVFHLNFIDLKFQISCRHYKYALMMWKSAFNKLTDNNEKYFKILGI